MTVKKVIVIVSLHLHQVQRKSVRRDIFRCSVNVATVIEEDESMSSNREAEETNMGMWWLRQMCYWSEQLDQFSAV